MTAAGLAGRLHARRSGNGWMARCPAHDDRSPSLSITERDGKILLHCHAGCSTESVCTAMGIELRDLFTDSTEPVPREVAHYNYLEENGSLLFQVVRYEPKDFKQRRPDGRGGWLWNLAGVRRVLYRLPEVLAASDVLIVEGEKDCETACALGFAATTNPGGAERWRPEYSDALRGKRVSILPDADEPGREHAEQVAASLHGKAAWLKVLEMPGSKDLSQWVERGGTREQLDVLIAAAPEWTPGTQNGSRIVLVSASEFLERKTDDEREWLVESLLPARSQTIWQGRPKVGKSTSLLQLAVDAASRQPAFGKFAVSRQVRTAFIELEEPEGITKARFAAILKARESNGPDDGFLWFISRSDLARWRIFPHELLGSRRTELARALRDCGVQLLILVALRRLLAGGDRNDPAFADSVSEALDALRDESEAAIALAHHTRKAPGETVEMQGMGSTNFAAWADAIFDLSRAADGLRLVRAEARFDAPDRFYLAKEPCGNGEVVVWAEAPADPKTAKREAVLRRVAAGESIHVAAKAEDVPYPTARRWAAEARGGEGWFTGSSRMD